MKSKCGRRRVAHKRGKKLEEEVVQIAKDLPLPPEMPLRQKMDAMERYLIDHPHTAATAVCMATGVHLSTYCSHVYRNKRGNTVNAQRLRTILKLIEIMHPHKDVAVNTTLLLRLIRSLGHTLGYETLRKMLNENGYLTYKQSHS